MKKEKKSKHFIKKAYYEGGLQAMKSFIKENLKYPKEAALQKIEGSVHLRYSINQKGEVIKVKIVSGVGYGCDKEAVRLVKLLKFEIPKNHSGKIIFHKTLQIHFKLPKAAEEKKIVLEKPPVAAPTVIEYSIV